MRTRQHLLLACLFVLPAGLLHGENPPDEDRALEGVEVLARGPIHEAFAQPPDVGQPEGGPVIPKEPPEAIEELPPEQKPEGDDVEWVPGYWQWDAERGEFLWISGAWRDPPPNRQWVPGHWRQVDGGWQWIAGFWAPAGQDDLTYQSPPPESLEAGPSLPPPEDADYFYTPGCWIWRETRYFWRPGYWARCRPDWTWVPARYVWSPAGCVFVGGYWDHPLDRRGLLFAPVCFTRAFRGPWCPSYVVSPSCLTEALFVQPSSHCYYFGDYFGPRYRKAGFTPWVDFRIGRTAVDPLFAYYRHSGGRDWERNIAGLYTARADGRLAPPPRTLAQQATVVRELRQGTTDAQRLRRATVLTPLADVPRQVTTLNRVSREERTRHQRAAGQLSVVARERSRAERELLSRREAPVRPSASPRTVPFEVPRAARSSRPAERVQSGAPGSPPPRSLQPRDLERRPAPRQELPPTTRRETVPVPRPEAVPPRHEAPPLPRRETVPTPRRDITPPPRIETPPPRRETRPLEQRREPPPSPRPLTPAPVPRTQPPAPRQVQPPPASVPRSVQPPPRPPAPERHQAQPPAPRQVQPPPAPRRVEAPPPARPAQPPRVQQAPPPAPRQVQPPPAPRRAAPPPPARPAQPPRVQHAPPPPAPKRVQSPPPAPARHAAPPPPRQVQHAPPSPARAAPASQPKPPKPKNKPR